MKKRNKNKNSDIFLDKEINDKEELDLNEDIDQSIEIVNRNREELEDERNRRINKKFERNASGEMIVRPKVRYSISANTITCICIVIILITWLILDFGPIFGIDITSNKNEDISDNKIELVTKESDIYGMYDEELFVYSNNTITTYNSKCEVTWTHMFSENFVPSIYTEGNYMLVSNNSTGIIYLFENKKEILNHKVNGVIKNSFIDKYGNMVIEYTIDSSHTDMISVYNKKGEEKYHFYHNNIIAMNILDDANKIIFTETVTDSAQIGVKFQIIDISKKESEQLQEIVSLDNQFVYDFVNQGRKIYALLDDKIVSIDIDSKNVETLKKFDSTQMLFVALNDKYFNYLERDIENGNYKIENINYSGNVICSTIIDSVPKFMANSDFVDYYIYQDHIYIQNKWGVELNSKTINFTPKQTVIFNNNKSLALIYTNKIYILNI